MVLFIDSMEFVYLVQLNTEGGFGADQTEAVCSSEKKAKEWIKRNKSIYDGFEVKIKGYAIQ